MDQTASPLIFKSPIPEKAVSENKKHLTEWIRKNIVKIVIALLVIGVAVELIFGGKALFSPSGLGSLNILAPRVNGLTDASLSLVPDQISYKSGDEVEIEVKLFTGGYTTDSTDLVLKYDPQLLAPAEDGFALEGDLYSEYPAMQVDKEKGLIGISGITLPGSNSFNGAGTFATMYFTALNDGQTKVSIDFESGATNESNVVLTGSSKDILGVVSGADILISGSEAQAPKAKDQSCAGFTQYCQDASGSAGTQICTGGSTKEGSCGYDSEFTISCGECRLK